MGVKYIFRTPRNISYICHSSNALMMAQARKVHLGQNIRDMRVLKGMKQETLGKKMGMAQQNVSKMEHNELPTDEILERAAKAMGTTVEAIKEFDKKNSYKFFFYAHNPVENNHPIKEVIQYFKEELLKEYEEKEALKDELSKLKAELEALKNGSAPESSATDGNVRKIKGK